MQSPQFQARWRLLRPLALAAALGCQALAPGQAAELLSGFGADGVYGELALTPNDDESSSLLNLPFEVNFYGIRYSSFYVNNNGNITFSSALGNFTPEVFPLPRDLRQAMIAPWWADVDTSVADSGGGDGVPPSLAGAAALAALATTPYAGPNNVYVGTPNARTLVVTWDQVGYFSQRTDLTNSFQLVLRSRADSGAGDFDIEFRYRQLQWTTGDASGGADGLGGTPARAGYDAGDGVNFLTLPGSGTAEVLELVNTSNVSASTPGLWSFAVRNGFTPGNTPDNPLLPVTVDTGYSFDFNVQANTQYFIDPLVAVGYDYQLSSSDASQSFASVTVASEVGDGVYALYLWNGSAFVDAGVVLQAGETYSFGEPTTRFSIRGIETSAALDPADPLAFVTGVSFTRSGAVNVLQSPLTVDVPAVPEPGSLAMLLAGLAALAMRRVRRDAR